MRYISHFPCSHWCSCAINVHPHGVWISRRLALLSSRVRLASWTRMDPRKTPSRQSMALFSPFSSKNKLGPWRVGTILPRMWFCCRALPSSYRKLVLFTQTRTDLEPWGIRYERKKDDCQHLWRVILVTVMLALHVCRSIFDGDLVAFWHP